MEYLSTADIREKYLRFFEEKGCKRMPSSSLIPDDPSLLLTSAGMVQFKPYFLQQKHLEAPYVGTTTVQKCVRTNDIDIIGTTGRHLSFFEMLGNFSFGDYFKEEMCAWALEFSTEVLGLPVDRLYFTVFFDDDETIEIWKSLGIPEERISRLGEEDNFWRAGPTGPCGPCSELYYDQGPEFGCGNPDCAPGCDCDRYLEYWNLVFTQYDGQEDGTLVELPKKNIDTGMGLERIAAIMQGVQSNYEIDLMRDLLSVGERLAGATYGEDAETDLSLRIIADHSRSVTFMISDGILPSNEGRGYVLRRLLRRAVMKGHLLGIEGPFLGEYVDKVIELMGDVYPEIVENRELTQRVVLSEEERFGSTLRQGQAYLDDALGKLEGDVLAGETAFTLHDTYGFPIEVTEEIADARGITVDLEGFERSMAEQRARARANAKDADKAWSTYGGVMSEIVEETGPTEFVGYTKNDASARVLAIVKDGARVDALAAGEEGRVVLDATPFYAEKGGQVGDIGVLAEDDVLVEVLDTKEPEKGLIAHTVKVSEELPGGRIRVGDTVRAAIDVPRRERIRRNHTATHILHWALRQVLGEHVKQAGSFVAPNRLRFDFTHFEGMTPEQIAEVERLSNQKIMENHAVRAYETSITSAREAGVIALFGEKYGEFVRVLDIEGVSQELCGGTHVSATSEIGFVKITGESSVGANLRRIEAVTSFDALEYMNRVEDELKDTASELKVPLFDVSERTAANLKAMKDLQDKRKNNKEIASGEEMLSILDTALDAGYPLIVANLGTADVGGLRNAWDIVRARLNAPGAAVLAADNNGTPILLAAGTPEAVEAGFDAGAVIKAISPSIKGGGGGKPSMAQAGGKDLSGIDAALDAARSMLVSA
ncbi:alanine--tRNA ligase [Raoultibacter phocaeensis]|uniref:alanine--tRNA ligase n=1 Tax=Raoultibacter phocaeensis TaxID=2479841 RepID=UPI00111AC514|nr:alanine--tRNA ligase [Raoultibacter phocaeensis]